MLIIRLQRTGKRNQADFRIVLAEKTASASKKYQEILGSFNPRKKVFKAEEERVKYWISQHVAMSPTIHNLFVSKGLMEGAKVKAFNTPKKPAEPVAATEPAKAAEAAPAEPTAPEQPKTEETPKSEEAKA